LCGRYSWILYFPTDKFPPGGAWLSYTARGISIVGGGIAIILWADIYGWVHSYCYGPSFIHEHDPNIFSRIEVPGSIIMAEEPSTERFGAGRTS
jgi:hypothetical protein